MLGVIVGSSDLFTLGVAAAVSSVRGSGSSGGGPCGGGEDSAVCYPRIFDVKSQRIVYVACKAEIVESFTEKLLNGDKVRGKGKENVIVGYSGVCGLGFSLVGLGFGLAGVKLAVDGFYSEGVVDIIATPVSGILGAERLLGLAILNEIVAACLRQYSADIEIRGLFFVRVGVVYGIIL